MLHEEWRARQDGNASTGIQRLRLSVLRKDVWQSRALEATPAHSQREQTVHLSLLPKRLYQKVRVISRDVKQLLTR